ncbi:MAG: thioredoxin domain-containing protein [Minisyncoccia bacterium]
MPCLIALIVFGVMGIFSASHRALAREAFDCIFRRVTLRPCNTGFQDKIKGKILSKLIARSTFLAKMVNKHYEVLSWIFFILMVGSTGYVLYGGYNFYVYGSCNGLNESGFCAFDPKGENNKTTAVGDSTCGITKNEEKKVALNDVNLSDFPIQNTGSADTVIFIGCYACDYSRKAYPDIQRLVERKQANYIFAHYPAKGDTNFLGEAGYAVRKIYGDVAFWQLNDYLFTADKEYILNKDNLDAILTSFNLDAKKVNDLINKTETKTAVENQVEELNKTNLYGTPTIFINSKPFVGPKPYRVYNSAINRFIFF